MEYYIFLARWLWRPLGLLHYSSFFLEGFLVVYPARTQGLRDPHLGVRTHERSRLIVDIYTIQEEAYKRGYEAGVKSVAYNLPPTDRERLIEAMASALCGIYSPTCDEWQPHDCGKCFANGIHIADIADHLITNGVTIPVRCKDCKQWCRNNGITDSPNGNCFYHDATTNGYDFCYYGERKDNGM